MEEEIEALNKRVNALEKALIHFIGCSVLDLGEAAAKQLIDMVNEGFRDEN